MPAPIVVFAALAYAGLLFAVAWRIDRSAATPRRTPPALVYILALAVYCTSWTFFGAVGTAVADGWSYLPIYLGPALVFLFGQDLLRRIAEIVRRENLNSVADLISSRYGKSRSVAALVAALATLGALPYIALQLKSLATSGAELVRGAAGASAGPASAPDGVVFLISVALATFAIVFGARRSDGTVRNRGLVAAVAVESAIKLAALVALAVFSTLVFLSLDPAAQAKGADRFEQLFSSATLDLRFLTITLLSTCAIVCLPRQFYIGFVECRDPSHLRAAGRYFPAYLLVTSLAVLPITLAGVSSLPSAAAPDLYVLDLPIAHGAEWLALLVFLGGFSAATGMVVVESVALATMISNNLFAPLLLRGGGVGPDRDVGQIMLGARRVAIATVILLAFVYYLAIDHSASLADLGLVAFAAVAQFAPALLGALYWTRGAQAGARLGLVVGLAVWLYTLFLPSVVGREALVTILGPALDPHALLGLKLGDGLTHGVVWSLGLNVAAYVLGSLAGPARVGERLRAAAFRPDRIVGGVGPASTLADLMELSGRFAGGVETQAAFAALAARRGKPLDLRAPLDVEEAREAERLIARVIGAPSARVIVASALRRGSLDLADVVGLLDETSQELSFSRELLSTTLENISQAVSVVDKDLRLVAWNQKYIEMFGFPSGLVQVGRPIADVIRFNALNGECGPGEVEAHVERRLAHYRRGAPHAFERIRPNGTVLKSTGNPMPGGGYVTSFTDITAEKRAHEALQAAKERLEERVAQRTAALVRAKQAADEATLGKTRFLAAASHDLLQPLNAARLFTAALAEGVADDPAQARLAGSIERSIDAADRLLRALLDISKLDAGGVMAAPRVFPLGPLLQELVEEIAPLAAEKGLQLRCAATSAHVFTDRTLLRSALQNFIVNAVRYTSAGTVLVGCRRRGERIAIEVVDTGPGIPVEKQALIFEEFRRLAPATHPDGAGLGLAIVDRIARILDAPIGLRSQVGRGSAFWISALRAEPPLDTGIPASSSAKVPSGLRVLCLDDDSAVLDALAELLAQWGVLACLTTTPQEALAAMQDRTFDAALFDFHLDDALTGLDVAEALRTRQPDASIALATADASPALAQAAGRHGAQVLRKPVAPDALREFLATASRVSAH